MKAITAILFTTIISISCQDPIHVTGKTDQQETTSGTLGNATAEKRLPRRNIDSVRTIDTTRIKSEGRKAD